VPESLLGSVLESLLSAGLGVYSQAGWLCAIECKCERPWEMPGSVLENILGVLGSVLRADLGAYSQVGWECHRVQLGVCLRAC